MPTSTRSALLRLGRPEREATDIDAMCERLKIGDLGRRVLVQCCADGKVCADDASETAIGLRGNFWGGVELPNLTFHLDDFELGEDAGQD